MRYQLLECNVLNTGEKKINILLIIPLGTSGFKYTIYSDLNDFMVTVINQTLTSFWWLLKQEKFVFLTTKIFNFRVTVTVLWVLNFFSSWIFVCLTIVFTGKSVILLGKEELLELSWLEFNPNKDENHERRCPKNKNWPVSQSERGEERLAERQDTC